jgi:hypothetical protein
MPSSLPETFVAALAAAIRETKLDAVVVGNAAAILQGAPLVTQDVDLFVRDTRLNRKKLERVARLIGGSKPVSISDPEVTNRERIHGALVPLDIHFDRIAGPFTFASVRSRSETIKIGKEKLRVAALADVIRSKEAADRAKDRAALPILRDALAVKKELEGLPARARLRRVGG